MMETIIEGGGNRKTRPSLPQVTLICVDTTGKVGLAERAMAKSMEQCEFGAVKLLTDDPTRRHSVIIPKISTMEGYSNFCVRELHKHVETSHALVVQWDGYVLNGSSWTDDFLKSDYIGAPWEQWRLVGNGGFSLRSRRLLQACASHAPSEPAHPEDSWICQRHRSALEQKGIRFAPYETAIRFAFEGRGFNGHEWYGNERRHAGQFGFHSFLTPLPNQSDRPLVFHHSGDLGDVIYAMAAMKALGGGTLFLSSDCKYPYPLPPRNCRTDSVEFCRNASSLLLAQDYVWGCQVTATTPFSADADFNRFREAYRQRTVQNWESLLNLQLRPWNLEYDPAEPWLTVPEVTVVPGRRIVVNRTARYRNDSFPWGQLVQKYGDQMVFVGTGEEYDNFRAFGIPTVEVPYYPTANALELAQVICGGRVFIGNQSSAMAIALGLGVPVIQEVWKGNANCRLKRPNAIYYETGSLDIPAEWLR